MFVSHSTNRFCNQLSCLSYALNSSNYIALGYLSVIVQYQTKLLELVATYRGFKVEPELVNSNGEVALCADVAMHYNAYNSGCIPLQSHKILMLHSQL